jgi:hypothetical protein
MTVAHEMDERENESARKIGLEVIEFCKEHEKQYHEGRPCIDNRISMMAYMAFGLGIFSGRTIHDALDIVAFQNLIDDYHRSHAAHVAEQAEKN